LNLFLENHEETDSTSYNVIAEVKGYEHPEQVLVMGGHIDSWDVGS
jgi:carboxypeptidase Q